MPHTKAFNELYASLTDEYLGTEVPRKYQRKYGKKYTMKDVKSLAYAIAKSRHIPID